MRRWRTAADPRQASTVERSVRQSQQYGRLTIVLQASSGQSRDGPPYEKARRLPPGPLVITRAPRSTRWSEQSMWSLVAGPGLVRVGLWLGAVDGGVAISTVGRLDQIVDERYRVGR